jgi:CRISPR-associated exonuclease Cas4
MFTEDDLLPISALQHLEFCPRQCGLIHLEGVWDENRLTAEGRAMHDKAHEPQTESRPGIRIARSLRLHSFRLGLSGQADVVEFARLLEGAEGGVLLEGASGRWQPIPVEYKRGAPKSGHCDIIQLCAQAICLEEMLAVRIDKGSLFYGRPRRRQEVIFTDEFRRETEDLAAKLHELVNSGKTPKAVYAPKCDNCSLMVACMPKVTGVKKNIERYLSNAKKVTEGLES